MPNVDRPGTTRFADDAAIAYIKAMTIEHFLLGVANATAQALITNLEIRLANEERKVKELLDKQK